MYYIKNHWITRSQFYSREVQFLNLEFKGWTKRQKSDRQRQCCSCDHLLSPQTVTDWLTVSKGLVAVHVYTAHVVVDNPIISNEPSGWIMKASVDVTGCPFIVQLIVGLGCPFGSHLT